MMLRIVQVAFGVLLLVGCNRPQVDKSYAGTARYRYQVGVEALEDGDYLEAVRHFSFVKNKFAYSKYAALSEIRVGDAYFAQDKYIEAIDTYRRFVESRPSHREVPYAKWRIGMAYDAQRPSGFFIFPPPFEKDQATTRQALAALNDYVSRFPEDEHVPEAQKSIRSCRRSLADHELYVADFYRVRERPESARGRLEGLVRSYEDVPDRWANAAGQLIDVYAELEMKPEAIALAKKLVATQPKSDSAESARAFLSGAK